MCGIVGLLVKKPALRESLGELMVPMLLGMAQRGPDSAGLAVFAEPLPETQRKYSLYSGGQKFNWTELAQNFQAQFGVDAEVKAQGDRAVLISPSSPSPPSPRTSSPSPRTSFPSSLNSPDSIKKWLKQQYPQLHVLSAGRTIDLYKDAGTPAAIAERYNFKSLQGSHLVGHTRMATE